MVSRLTGSDAHRAHIEDVASKLAALGLNVRRDTHRFTRWDVRTLRLEIDGASLPIASAYPYSGVTSGITRRLIRVNRRFPCWSKARGEIAVLEVPYLDFPRDAFIGGWTKPDRTRGRNPVLSSVVNGPDLDKARKAGVAAVICVWRGMPDAVAQGQYTPFTLPYHDIPAVWVSGAAGDRVLDAARRGASATLVLDATLTPDCAIDTLWAIAPGQSNETILINTHTDGTNVLEENGHVALLELARIAVEKKHQRTIVFILMASHLRIPAVTKKGQATTAWLEAHRELWANRAVVGMCLEHFGAREYRDGVATGRPEPELLYATTKPLSAILAAEWRGATVSKPGALIHFGEGEPFYDHDIPGVALVPTPEYLVAESDIDFVDSTLMRRQIDNFKRLLERFDAMPRADFGRVRKPGLLRKALALLRVFLLRLR